VIVTTLAIVLAVVAASTLGQPPGSRLPLEGEAARLLADQTQTFTALGDLADRLRAALANSAEPTETRGRLALAWVRATRRTLGAIPFTVNGTTQEPYRTWLADHADDIVYSEPAGQWLMRTEHLWQLHDAHRRTASAEPLAWDVVNNGLPGECEGYPPCYLAGLDLLHAEYLRRHPSGAHAAEAVEQIRQSNEQSVDLTAGPKAHEFFNPATDCVDLIPKAATVRAALVQAGVDAKAAIALVDKLRALCRN
jgi:hypothetical protein